MLAAALTRLEQARGSPVQYTGEISRERPDFRYEPFQYTDYNPLHLFGQNVSQISPNVEKTSTHCTDCPPSHQKQFLSVDILCMYCWLTCYREVWFVCIFAVWLFILAPTRPAFGYIGQHSSPELASLLLISTISYKGKPNWQNASKSFQINLSTLWKFIRANILSALVNPSLLNTRILLKAHGALSTP